MHPTDYGQDCNMSQDNPSQQEVSSAETTSAAKPEPKKENMLVNLVFNMVIPFVILSKLSGEEHLGTEWAVVVALAFPFAYGLKDFFERGKVNFFSVLGVISVFLTGGMALLKLPPEYIAIKEAAIPALLGLATLISMKTRFPLVRTFLYNDKILKIDKVNQALDQHDNHAAFDKALNVASYVIAGSFMLSSSLNYILAIVVLKSEPGTEAFNAELGTMQALSFPVIALPATLVLMGALFYLFKKIHQLTELKMEDIING